jgi:hypothetical protein
MPWLIGYCRELYYLGFWWFLEIIEQRRVGKPIKQLVSWDGIVILVAHVPHNDGSLNEMLMIP